MALQALTITLSDNDGRVNVDLLIKTLENALVMLRGISAQMIDSAISVEWEVVHVQMNSPLQLTLAPRVKGKTRSAAGTKLVKACLDGVKKLEQGPTATKFFDVASRNAARNMISVARKIGASVQFSSASKPESTVTLTDKTIHHIEQLETPDRLYVDYSSIEGRLDMISVHDGKRLFLWESLTNHKIECIISDDLFEKYVTLEMLGRRVSISGRVHYKNHIPQRIHVEGAIRTLRTKEQLPQPQEMSPINITDGATSEDHVWRMRNG